MDKKTDRTWMDPYFCRLHGQIGRAIQISHTCSEYKSGPTPPLMYQIRCFGIDIDALLLKLRNMLSGSIIPRIVRSSVRTWVLRNRADDIFNEGHARSVGNSDA